MSLSGKNQKKPKKFQKLKSCRQLPYHLIHTIYSIFLKFIYSEKATKFCEISTVDLTGTIQDKSTVEILQHFVAFSEYKTLTDLQQPEITFSPFPLSLQTSFQAKVDYQIHHRNSWVLTFCSLVQVYLESFSQVLNPRQTFQSFSPLSF